MADVVRVFETFLRTTRLSFTRDLGATPTFLSAAGTTVTPHRIDCDCCGKRSTSSWYIPTLQGCGNDEEKRAAWQRIHRQTVRRRTDEEFQSMDLLMLPRVELPPPQRRPSQKGREQQELQASTAAYGQRLRVLNEEIRARGLSKAQSKDEAFAILRADDEEQSKAASYRPPKEIRVLLTSIDNQSLRVCLACAQPFLSAARKRSPQKDEQKAWVEVCAIAQGIQLSERRMADLRKHALLTGLERKATSLTDQTTMQLSGTKRCSGQQTE